MDATRLLDRFLRYVKIDTTANEQTDAYPSSPGQLELGRILVEEMQAAGIEDATQDAHGIVLGTVPATSAKQCPTIAFCAHQDTSPETTGAGVRPNVIKNYSGGDIVLSGDPSRTIRVDQTPELSEMIGRTLITTDGTTLLGADDKSGIAVIMEAATWMMEHPEIEHGPIRICFTCDEEIGRGVDKLDVPGLGAICCYTLDGSGADTIDVETFSADLAIVTITGVNIHPSIAKGRMTNAVRAAAMLLEQLPRDTDCPENTADRQGFLHPYEIQGGVASTTVRILLRDFDSPGLEHKAALLRDAVATTARAFPEADIDLAIRPQYRNMAEGLSKEPRAVTYAKQAHTALGRSLEETIVRGGTDGSRMTELGLPCPNLASGQHTPHSPLEWACLEEMLSAGEAIVELAKTWAAQ